MSARMVVQLSDGNKVLFGSTSPNLGMADGAVAASVPTIGEDKLKSALGSLGGFVSALEKSVGDLARKPDTFELEFGVSLTADADLWVVSGQAQAELKVTLSWSKGE